MTKKDYEIIAGILRKLRGRMLKKRWEPVVESFTHGLARTSKNFDCNKFIDACYEKEEEEVKE